MSDQISTSQTSSGSKSSADKKKISVDRKTCIGCGICTSIAPEAFEMDTEGKSVPKNPAGANVEDARDACPVGAISIAD